MTQQYEKTFQFELTPDDLVKVMTSQEYTESWEKEKGALEVTIKEISSSEERLVREIHTTEYARGITGIDKSKTEVNVNTQDWDLKNHKCSWTLKMPHGPRVRVAGTMQVSPSGDQAQLTSRFSVDVKIPLVGGKIEKMVGKEVEKGWPRFEKVLREHCDKK
jgi:hypothetical protein